MALYCYANGWNAEGEPNFKCTDCKDSFKKAFGCGYDPKYSGTSKMKQNPKYDLKGICPGWWRQQKFVLDTVEYANWKSNLGHPNDIPNRLIEAISWLEYHQMEAEKALAEIRKRNMETKR
jgi:hypothetical protein